MSPSYCDFVDGIDQRTWYSHGNAPNQSIRYVFIARVLLGNSYLCKRPRAFKRTPCMHRKCYSDSCSHHMLSGSYDSVIRIAKGGIAKREYESESSDENEYFDGRTTFKTISFCADDREISYCADERDFLIYSSEQSYPDFLIEYQ